MKNSGDEKILVKACLKGDIIAQKRFYHRFGAKMLAVCWRYAKTREEAEDLLQEGFLNVFKSLSSYQFKGSLEGWVRKIIVNVALQKFRKQSLTFDSNIEIEHMNLENRNHEQIYQQFEIKDLLSMLDILPRGCRIIFNLYVLEEFNHKEIAEKLNITIGTSKSQLAKARNLIKEQMKISQLR